MNKFMAKIKYMYFTFDNHEKALRLYPMPSDLQNSLNIILNKKKWNTSIRATRSIQNITGRPPYECPCLCKAKTLWSCAGATKYKKEIFKAGLVEVWGLKLGRAEHDGGNWELKQMRQSQRIVSLERESAQTYLNSTVSTGTGSVLYD